jgi:hypothetical protein
LPLFTAQFGCSWDSCCSQHCSWVHTAVVVAFRTLRKQLIHACVAHPCSSCLYRSWTLPDVLLQQAGRDVTAGAAARGQNRKG